MFVVSSTGRRLAAVGLLIASLLASLPAQSQGTTGKGKARRAATQPATPLRDGQAEARLLQVFQLTSEGRTREALASAERLVHDYPRDRKSVV